MQAKRFVVIWKNPAATTTEVQVHLNPTGRRIYLRGIWAFAAEEDFPQTFTDV